MAELTTPAKVQDYLGDSTLTSGQVTPYIDAAERLIAHACDRLDPSGNHWLSASHVERIDGEHFPHVLLRFTPVTAIASVAITSDASSSVSIPLTELECDGIAIASLGSNSPATTGRLGYRASAAGGSLTTWWDAGLPMPNWAWSVRSPNFGGGRSRVVVTYTGGYASAPADLAMAATILAAEMWRAKGRDPDLVSQTLGQFSQTYRQGKDQDTSLGSVYSLIRPYMRTVC